MEKLRYDEDKAFLLADDAATIARIVRTVPPETLRTTKLHDWTALEVIGHVTDAAEIFAERVRRCVDEDNPVLESYDQDELAAARRNNEKDPMDLSKRLSRAHARIVTTLQAPGAASRPGRHTQQGQLDAGHFAAYQADHAHTHTSDLASRFPPRA